MPNCLTASVLLRAYLKRLPSGVYRVTVLSAALPRPLFRMYPAELGEAVAVERSVGHALCALQQRTKNEREQRNKPSLNAVFAAPDETAENDAHEGNRQRHSLIPAVNVVVAQPLTCTFPATPYGNDGWDSNCAEHDKSEYTDVKHVLRHGSPHGVNEPVAVHAVCSNDQAGADGYAVKGGHLAASPFKEGIGEVSCAQSNEDSTPKCRFSEACNAPADEHYGIENYAAQIPQPTQHLRLRVVWQGLL